jgi:hypothetical protein
LKAGFIGAGLQAEVDPVHDSSFVNGVELYVDGGTSAI